MIAKGRSSRGVTLIELLITIVIVAIVLSLALPSYRTFMEKRQITSAAQDLVNFIRTGQSLAVKNNEFVNLKWNALNASQTSIASASHPASWCIGLYSTPERPSTSNSDLTQGCDCRLTDATAANACVIDGVLYRMGQRDYANLRSEFLDFRSSRGLFTFDPVRGIIDQSSTNLYSEAAFDVHSSQYTKVDGERLFELRIQLRATGEAWVCTDSSSIRAFKVTGFPAC